ncbi:hypothetical protein ACFY5D_18080 [Paeniglutamicibacter sp. NPDC012692]|uniref:hypothetical protein n=1 Tax=Paeniglutamicibacter sp. NPDC012692 TaxID=3364388 RepID=UPI00369E9AAF
MDNYPQRLLLKRAEAQRTKLEELSTKRHQLFKELESNRIMIQLVAEERTMWLDAAKKLES